MEYNTTTSEEQKFESQFQERPVSIGNWLITMLLMCIPLVNIIMLFVWGFSSSTPKSKSNWAKATLIVFIIMIVIMGLLWKPYMNAMRSVM